MPQNSMNPQPSMSQNAMDPRFGMQPGMNPPPREKKPKKPMGKKAKVLILISSIVVLLAVAAVLVLGLVSPGEKFISEHLPDEVLSYEISGKKQTSSVGKVTVKEKKYGFFGGTYTLELELEDEMLKRTVEVSLEVKGPAWFWKVDSYRFTKDTDTVTIKEAGKKFLVEDAFGYALPDEYLDESDKVFDHFYGEINISWETSASYKYADFSGRVYCTGEFDQEGDHHKRIYEFYPDDGGPGGTYDWHLEGYFADGSSEGNTSNAITVVKNGDTYDVGVYSERFGRGVSKEIYFYSYDYAYDVYATMESWIATYTESGDVGDLYMTISFYPDQNPTLRLEDYNSDYDETFTLDQVNFAMVDTTVDYEPVPDVRAGNYELPAPTDDVLYVYSYNSEIETLLNYFYEEYPEYKDLVVVRNIGASATDEVYRDALKDGIGDSANEPVGMAVFDSTTVDWVSPEDYLPLSQIGFTEEMYGNAFPYTKRLGSKDGELYLAFYASNGGAFSYRKDIAEEVFGTSDPETIGEMMKDWDSFLEMAKTLREAGYYTLSSEMDLQVGMGISSGYYQEDHPQFEEVLSALRQMDAIHGTSGWSEEWNDDMDGNVFGFFSCGWFNDFILSQYTTAQWAVCEPVEPFFWGGAGIAVPKSCTNPNLAALILYTLCANETVMKRFGEDENWQPNNTYAINNLNGGWNSDYFEESPLEVYTKTAEKLD